MYQKALRFETPAEIKMFHMLGGDTVGMTNVPEVNLANEAEMAYATISMITNYAAGISESAPNTCGSSRNDGRYGGST